MNFESFWEDVPRSELPNNENRLLQLGDVQAPIPSAHKPDPNELNRWAGYFAVYWFAGRFSESFIQEVKISPDTAEKLKNTAQQSRHAIRSSVLSLSEEALHELGWKRWVTPGSSYTVWQVPKGREMLSVIGTRSPQLYGRLDLSQTEPIWRNANGSLFYADPALHPSKYRLERMLTSRELASAHANGALNLAECHFFRNITSAEKEMQALLDLEKKLGTGANRLTLKDLAGNRGLSELISVEKHILSQHNCALQNAREEVTAGREAYRQYRGYAFTGVGTLIGTKVVNERVDDTFFKGAPLSTRTYLIDGVSPLVALSRAHWAGKTAAIVGGHFASRHYDAKDAKSPAGELENRFNR
jgi:hypothetical protein